MTLEEVLPALKEGKEIRRKSWKPEKYLCVENPRVGGDNLFLCSKKHLVIIIFTFDYKDTFAKDWEIL